MHRRGFFGASISSIPHNRPISRPTPILVSPPQRSVNTPVAAAITPVPLQSVDDVRIAFESFVRGKLLPIASAAISTVPASHRETAAWQTRALHAHVAKLGSSLRCTAFVLETTERTLRLRTTHPTSLKNVGISWSTSRNAYVAGIKTKESSLSPSSAFPSCRIALPVFCELMHALCITTAFILDKASVKCRCGVDIPNMSVMRVIAGERPLYEGSAKFVFSDPDGAAATKCLLQSEATRACDKEACKIFVAMHRNRDVTSPCPRVAVNAAVAKGIQLLEAAKLSTPHGTLVLSEFCLRK